MPAEHPRSIALCLEYSIFAYGGTEVLVGELIRQLGSDYELDLVSADATVAGTWVESRVRSHTPWVPGTEPSALLPKLRSLAPQVVHFHLGGNYSWNVRRPSRSPLTVAGSQGMRVLTTNHGFFSGLEGYCAEYRPFPMKLALLPAAWLAKMRQLSVTRAEVAVSRYDYRHLRRWYWPARQRFRWIYHSKLPATLPTPTEDGRDKVIVCVGTIGARKNQALLVEAFAEVASCFPEWRLEFLGRSGDERMLAAIEAMIRKAGLQDRVRRIEGLGDEAIAKRLQKAEIFAMPSTYEGLGLALQEALYHGCACISTHSGGPEDLIDDGVNGLLVPKEDVTALAGALTRCMSDPELRKRFREAGPRSVRAKRMSAAEMAASYRELYSWITR